MPQIMHRLPDGVIYAKPGEFLVCQGGREVHRVYQVHGLYVIHQLLPVESMLGGAKSLEFIEQSAVAASAEPALHYLVSEFDKTFPTNRAARESISQHSLPPALPQRYLDVRQFTVSSCEVRPG